MKFFLSILFIFLIINLNAQNAPGSGIVKGIVIDSSTNKPLSYVTIALMDKKTQQEIKSTLTDTIGAFELKQIPIGQYKLSLIFIGYKTKVFDLPDFSQGGNSVIQLPTLYLSPFTNELKGVTITSAKPIIKQKIDRIIYDVDADPESKTMTVLDIFHKVPMISVDGADNIKLKGNSNFKILINGKESSLYARDPSEALKVMPASAIQSVEVITIPPAKYDAEGFTGIINIVTKKNLHDGYNASVNSRYNNIYGPAGGISGTIKQGKFGLFGYAGLSKQLDQTTASSNYLTVLSPINTYLSQTGDTRFGTRSKYVNAEVSYEIDTLSLLTGSVNYSNGVFSQTTGQFSQLFDKDENLTQSYNLSNLSSDHWNSLDIGFNYQLGFKHKKGELLTTSYKYSSYRSNQNAAVKTDNQLNYSAPDFNQYNNYGIKEHTIQLDYNNKIKRVTIEAGIKSIFRKSFSDFETDSLNNSTNIYIVNSAASNNFNYTQDVYSAYNTYEFNFGSYGIKAGARDEFTNIAANFISTNNNVSRNYNNLIPSISFQKRFTTSSINFGFTERIERPGIFQLNPFVNSINPKYLTVGNPNLQPVLNHVFDLTFSKFSKGAVIGGLSYAFANNTIQNVVRVNPQDTVTTSTYDNVGKSRNFGASLNVNYPLTQKLYLNFNSQLMYIWLSGFYDGQSYSNKGLQGSFNCYMGYDLGNGWRAGVNGNFTSSSITLQGHTNANLNTSGNVTKNIFKNAAAISFYFTNPESKFYTSKSYIRTPDFQETINSQRYFRSFGISLSYHFGKLNEDIKRNQKTINNDDIRNVGKRTAN